MLIMLTFLSHNVSFSFLHIYSSKVLSGVDTTWLCVDTSALFQQKDISNYPVVSTQLNCVSTLVHCPRTKTLLGPPPAGITLQAVVKDPYHPARSLVPPQTETAWSASQVLLSYGFTYQTLANQTKLVRWIPPVVDFCLNVDGASKGNPGNSLIAEARALCDGLRLAHFVGVRLSAIYSDSSTLVHSMQQGKCPSWLIHRWWRSSRDLLDNGSSFVHVFRETNQVADRLANHAIYSMCNEKSIQPPLLDF
ncbi:hypothetical protein Taro_044544 [Colocasia esculenta]|uniref:RNase H type-1 domain-containing protein n=1 Tax=Colocasia esculenta TaxID=4460 RepID=A0A843WM74_COLES|nr:hypothetical protein [Colocasia esculenta]